MMAPVPPASLERTARLLADSAEIARGLAAMSEQRGEPNHVELFTRVAREAEARVERLRELDARIHVTRATRTLATSASPC